MTIPRASSRRRVWSQRRIRPDESELARAVRALRDAKKPFIIAGGGVLYSEASAALAGFAERHGIPVAETQAGKSSLPFTHALNMGAVGVTGTSAANQLCRRGRCRARRRHAASGFHHRLLGPVQESGRRPSSASTRRPSTPPSIALCRSSPTRAPGSKSSPPISAATRRRLPGPKRRRTASRPG